MRIGINCYVINPNYKGGVNTYTFGLIDGFISEGKEYQFQIYVNKKNKKLFNKYALIDNVEVIVLKNSIIRKIIKRVAICTGIMSFYKKICDFLYGFVTEIMYKNSDVIYVPTTVLFPLNYKNKTILSMHDIQQYHYPEFFTKRELKFRKIMFTLSAQISDYIQASSNFIKKDLLDHFDNLRKEQVFVINEGVMINKFSGAEKRSDLFLKYKIPEKFLFFPAQLWPHKNHITVLKALLKLNNKGIRVPLVLTGAGFSAKSDILSFIKSNKMDYIYYLGVVSFDDLVFLYQQARFLITAVLYESSSLPILEAAASKTPIIASKVPSNVELSKKLSINMFEAENVQELVELILKVWNDDKLIKEQVRINDSAIYDFSWNRVAQKYLEFFNKIIGIKEYVN